MMEKICKTCGELKKLDDYYRHPSMADGHLGKCKECQKKSSNDARHKNLEKYREYDRARANNPDRVIARRNYRKTEAGIAAHARGIKAYRERFPMKYAAHTIVNNAKRNGDLIAPKSCEHCNVCIELEAHHDDYTKPLDVTWLCKNCHDEWHRNNEPIYK